MSLRATKWTIWLLLYCAAPVPYTLGAVETAPPLRLAFFSLIIVGLRLTEGAGGWVWNSLLALGLVQAAFYAVFFYFVASFLSRLFARASDSGRQRAVLTTVATVLLLAYFIPIYETPISSDSLYSTLAGILR